MNFIPKEKFDSKLIRGPEGRILWQQSCSPYNVNLAECLSALIKCARVNDWREACWFAYQLFISGEEVEKWAWLHLRTHCVEDIGPAHPESILVISELERSYFLLAPGSERRYLTGHWAVRYLSSLTKDRSNDESYAKMIIDLREGNPGPEIPDRALDYHITKGKQLGRSVVHFYEEATILQPRASSYGLNNEDRMFLLKRAYEKEAEEVDNE